MKRLFLIIVLLLALVACSKKVEFPGDNGQEVKDFLEKEEERIGDNENNEEENGLRETFTFTNKGIKIVMNEDETNILAGLGEALESFEAPSCAFKGMDQFYVYPGYELSTYPFEGKNYISSIVFMDDSVSTDEGISIGSIKDDVIKAYGRNYIESGNLYTYRMGDTNLAFVIKDGFVEDISYTAIAGNQE